MNEWHALTAAFAVENHCVARWCDATPLTETRMYIENQWTPFVSGDVDKRTIPEKILPGARSMVVLGADVDPPLTPSSELPNPGVFSGYISDLGVQDDYHIRLKQLLHRLAALLQTREPFRYRILVDSGTLDERALAVRAGLGYYGRNGLVVSPDYGSFFHIGLLLTDLPLPEGLPVTHNKQTCPVDCAACVRTCPGQAIPSGGYAINAAACVSYLTQKEGPLQETEMAAMGRQLYGCDVCRLVCPLGRRTAARPRASMVSLEAWLTMTDRQFAARYGHTAMLWRGIDILRRNGLIALGNAAKTQEAGASPEGLSEASRLAYLARAFLSHRNEGVATAARYAYKWLHGAKDV